MDFTTKTSDLRYWMTMNPDILRQSPQFQRVLHIIRKECTIPCSKFLVYKQLTFSHSSFQFENQTRGFYQE